VADAPDYFGGALVLQTRIASFMPPEPPALVPEVPATAPSCGERMKEAAQSAWSRWRGAEPEPPAPEPGQGSRAHLTEPSQVRGVPGGLRGLAPPR